MPCTVLSWRKRNISSKTANWALDGFLCTQKPSKKRNKLGTSYTFHFALSHHPTTHLHPTNHTRYLTTIPDQALSPRTLFQGICCHNVNPIFFDVLHAQKCKYMCTSIYTHVKPGCQKDLTTGAIATICG